MFCRQAAADDKVFAGFRRNRDFVNIMEHVDRTNALKYIDEIKSHKRNLLKHMDKFRINDSVGNPVVEEFEPPFGKLAPTTIRYIKVLHDLYRMFGSLKGKDVVEIGPGYGGQCRLVMEAFDVGSYSVVDLPECMSMSRKYLEKCRTPVDKFSMLDAAKLPDRKYYLAVSNYAFSECTREIQDLYIQKIMKNSLRGYITCNFISDRFNIQSYPAGELMKKLSGAGVQAKMAEEVPLTFKGNVLIHW